MYGKHAQKLKNVHIRRKSKPKLIILVEPITKINTLRKIRIERVYSEKYTAIC